MRPTSRVLGGAGLLLAGVAGAGQGQRPPSSGVEPIATLRLRTEAWDWFDPGAAGRYGLLHGIARGGLTQRRGAWQWRLEGAVPFLAGLPNDAVAPAPAGALGLGATYFSANGQERNAVGLIVKQAWVRWAGGGHAARLGRFEFSDGAERAPATPALAQLKTQRIGQRLLGPFGFSPVGRSFDGLHYAWDRGGLNVTALAVRPTEGVFRASGQGSLAIDLGYAAVTRGWRGKNWERDARLFALWYADRRGAVPTDSRPLAVRTADRSAITLATVGAHWIETRPVGRGSVDLLAWGAIQTGHWGVQSHRAQAASLEAGIQHPALPWSLWFRGGFFRSSGDADPADGRHGTFFVALPTPRPYARFPFYNQMNSGEVFLTATARPARTLTARLGAHSVSLASSADLWYLGGGAFEDATFGYQGRPANGATGLATVADLSVAWQARRNLGIEWYAARARGRAVIDRIYGARTGSLMYLEVNVSR